MPAATSSLLDFFILVGQLKSTKRTGWVISGVHLPESVADHMYRASLISLVLSPAPARDHAVKLALAHDLAEARVGDLTPHCGVSAADKHAREREAMAEIRDTLLAGSDVGAELYRLWEEYEAGESEAAVLMKDIDKFEMILTAFEYEQRGMPEGIDLQEFYTSTEGKFWTPQIQALVKELMDRRNGWKARGKE